MVDCSKLTSQLDRKVECFVFDAIPSTNDFLLQKGFGENTQICVTREQIKGKGQHGRSWACQKDASVLLSIRYNFDSNCYLGGLSLAVGLAVIQTLEQDYGLEGFKLKWPNDILFNDKKLSGILIENQTQGTTQSAVIGLGLNYCVDEKLECKTPWTDLSNMMEKLPTLEALNSQLAVNIIKACDNFAKLGFAHFKDHWHAYDYLYGKPLIWEREKQILKGVACGIGNDGALKLQLDNNIQRIYSSEHIQLI